ncbi:helix-turn-helix transcriptional regulator [Shouchella patagoniensis]|uniref:helix-turn-helix transcriptional regulator n=1 Tax=Shouchella patagoniensis TaxID=228576 RepID=UPI0009959253|nr:response regulator transcription factor [Shouchella patagoniensis]
MKALLMSKHCLLAELFQFRLSQDDFFDLHMVESVEAVNRYLQEHDPKLVFIFGEEAESLEWMKHVRNVYKDVALIVLANDPSYEYTMMCIKCAVNGLLLTETTYDHLISSVEKVLTGDFVYDKQLLKDELGHFATIRFSRMEKKVIYYLTNEYSNKKIAQKMNLNEGTVRNYISSIYSKIGIHNRKDAIPLLVKWMESKMVKST